METSEREHYHGRVTLKVLHTALSSYHLRHFCYVEFDYIGPFLTVRGRGTEKRRICLFTCLAISVLHNSVFSVGFHPWITWWIIADVSAATPTHAQQSVFPPEVTLEVSSDFTDALKVADRNLVRPTCEILNIKHMSYENREY